MQQRSLFKPSLSSSFDDNTININHDDGGAAKSNDRLNRRKRRRILELVSLPAGILCIIVFLMKVQLHLNEKLNEKRIRNKVYLENMKRAFTGTGKGSASASDYNSDNNNSDNNEYGNYIGGAKPGYERMESLKPKHRFSDTRQLPPIHSHEYAAWIEAYTSDKKQMSKSMNKQDFRVEYKFITNNNDDDKNYDQKLLWWEKLAQQISTDENNSNTYKPPKVDYTQHSYTYPNTDQKSPNNRQFTALPPIPNPSSSSYPPLQTLQSIFQKWPQDDIDTPPSPFKETLYHFNYQNDDEMAIAKLYRDLELPFKIYNIPEIDLVSHKWTDDYLSFHFDRMIRRKNKINNKKYERLPPSQGKAQYSIDSFFAFFTARNWNINKLGPPPTLDTDLSFQQWSTHAKYADAISLPSNSVHYYWQSGVSSEEKYKDPKDQSMIAHDLSLFNTHESNPNFFSFNPKEQKGIQCRFGERGVTAATHYDGGRNMVAMITGAKRYILSPPKECGKLGIVSMKKHPSFRHSMLNFGHINLLEDIAEEIEEEDVQNNKMSDLERQWLNISKNALAIDTILKAGEVLYIPSHWFHYIISLQKSAQCNVRSGRHFEGHAIFGGEKDVRECDTATTK